MSPRTYNLVERTIIILMLLGMLGMFQPFAIVLFRYGFLVLLFNTFAFIVVSHLAPGFDEHDLAGPVSVHEAVAPTGGQGDTAED